MDVGVAVWGAFVVRDAADTEMTSCCGRYGWALLLAISTIAILLFCFVGFATVVLQRSHGPPYEQAAYTTSDLK
jgi:hypothetical protein